jgi:hypothetical protein
MQLCVKISKQSVKNFRRFKTADNPHSLPHVMSVLTFRYHFRILKVNNESQIFFFACFPKNIKKEVYEIILLSVHPSVLGR